MRSILTVAAALATLTLLGVATPDKAEAQYYYGGGSYYRPYYAPRYYGGGYYGGGYSDYRRYGYPGSRDSLNTCAYC